MEKETKLYIATPMYGGQCSGSYTMSLLQLQLACAENNIQFSYGYLMNESLITRGRNYLAHMFYEKTDCTHLMFIDADIKFNPADIIKMIQADKDIICGVYSRKEINWQGIQQAALSGIAAENLKYFAGTSFTKPIDPELGQDYDVPVEVEHGGTGFMLIKREVIKQLKDKVEHYIDEYGEPIANLFETSLSKHPNGQNDLLSEDYHFCKLLRDNGGKVYAAPWVWLDHLGLHIYSGAFGRIPNQIVKDKHPWDIS